MPPAGERSEGHGRATWARKRAGLSPRARRGQYSRPGPGTRARTGSARRPRGTSCRAPGLIQLPDAAESNRNARARAPLAGSILVRLELHLPGLLLAYRVYRAVRPPGARKHRTSERGRGRARVRREEPANDLKKEREPVKSDKADGENPRTESRCPPLRVRPGARSRAS